MLPSIIVHLNNDNDEAHSEGAHVEILETVTHSEGFGTCSSDSNQRIDRLITSFDMDYGRSPVV